MSARGNPADASEAWSRDLVRGGSVRRILVIKWSAMGDVVIATAAIEDLGAAFPEASIDLDVMAPWDSLFEGDPRLAAVHVPRLRERGLRLRETRAWLERVRAARYDLVVDLQSNDHTRLLLSLLRVRAPRVPHVAGYHRRFPYDIAPDHPPRGVHVHDRARALLRALGAEPRAERPVLHVPEEDQRHARSLLARHGLDAAPYAVFLPGSQAAGYLKRWGAGRYAALAALLRARGIERVALLGGPDEVDECREIRRRAGDRVVDLCCASSIRALVPLAVRARLVVANDTGTAHVVAAAGRPMIVLCGPTDPRRVRPLGARVDTLQADLPCVNCYRKHCPHQSCMRLLTPASVAAAATVLAGLEAS